MDASYIDAQTAHVWRETLPAGASASFSDRADYPPDCSLEYRRTDCSGGAMDASPANRQNHPYASWLSRLGFTASAAKVLNCCSTPEIRGKVGRLQSADMLRVREA